MTNYINLDNIGTILKEEFIEPLSLSMNALAKAIGVPTNRIHGIVHGTRKITADTDLLLTHYFGLTQGYFLRLQNRYDMIFFSFYREEQLKKIVPFKSLEKAIIAKPANCELRVG